jgi:hypothetical protein
VRCHACWQSARRWLCRKNGVVVHLYWQAAAVWHTCCPGTV